METAETLQDWLDMQVGESKKLPDNYNTEYILAVPGGWVVQMYSAEGDDMCCCFVPLKEH